MCKETCNPIHNINTALYFYPLKESTELEVHLAHGTDYTTIASCKLRFRDIFDKPHGRVHGTADVISELLRVFIAKISQR